MGEFYSIANDSIEMSLFFMGATQDLLGLIPVGIRGGLIIFNLFRASITCYSEYMYGLGNPYRELYGGIKLKQSSTTTPTQAYTPLDSLINQFKVQKTGFDAHFDLLQIFDIAVEGTIAVYIFISQKKFDSFFLGHTVAGAVSRLIMLFDKSLSLGMIAPAKPWVTLK